MTPKEAKKILEDMGYELARGTRGMEPQQRAQAKAALKALGAAGESYKKPAPKKSSRKSKPIEDSEVTHGS